MASAERRATGEHGLSVYYRKRFVANIYSCACFKMILLAILMSVKPNALLADTKIANVFHHPVQDLNMKFNHYIYIIDYHSNLIIISTNPL